MSANTIVTEAGVDLPTAEKTAAVFGTFSKGVPYDGAAAVGDFINAGWRVFYEGEQKIHAQQGRSLVDYISDLILKSAENHEIERLLK